MNAIVPETVSKLTGDMLKISYSSEWGEWEFDHRYNELLGAANYMVINLDSIDRFEVCICKGIEQPASFSAPKYNFMKLKLFYLSGNFIEFVRRFSAFDVDLFKRGKFENWIVQLLTGESVSFQKSDANLGRNWVATYSTNLGSDEKRLVECKPIYDIIDAIIDYRKPKC